MKIIDRTESVGVLLLYYTVLRIRIRDLGSGAFLTPGSGIRCLFDPWIRDPGWVKNKNPDPEITTRINFSGSGFLVFWFKILEFFDVDPGKKKIRSGMEKIWIRDGKNSDPG